VKAVLTRPLYRGEIVYGRTAVGYGRELGKRAKMSDGQWREKGVVLQPETAQLRLPVREDLRIFDPDLAARIDARLADNLTRWHEAVKSGKWRGPAEHAHGRYLLTRGMLLCPTCGGHFERRSFAGGVNVCATNRRQPGTCSNKLTLLVTETDEIVLSMIQQEVLGTRLINQLLALVDNAPVDKTAYLTERRAGLRDEVNNLVKSIVAGVPAESVAPASVSARTRSPASRPAFDCRAPYSWTASG